MYLHPGALSCPVHDVFKLVDSFSDQERIGLLLAFRTGKRLAQRRQTRQKPSTPSSSGSEDDAKRSCSGASVLGTTGFSTAVVTIIGS